MEALTTYTREQSFKHPIFALMPKGVGGAGRFFERSIFLGILENRFSYSSYYSFVKVPYLRVIGWPAPAPPSPLTIKAVYVVFYE